MLRSAGQEMKLWLSLVVLLILDYSRLCRTQAPVLSIKLRESYVINPVSVPRYRLCHFTGRPAPNVTWTYNGNRLPTSGNSDGVYYLPDTGTLVFEKADSSDDGTYKCTGMNQFGNRSASTEITFERPGSPWYINWYMWFVYAIILWALSILLFVLWFLHQKKQAKKNLLPPDEWIGN